MVTALNSPAAPTPFSASLLGSTGSFCISFFPSTGDWTQNLMHARQMIYAELHPHALSLFSCCWGFFSLFCETVVWTQDSALAKQVLYCLSHTFRPFFPGYFGNGVSWTICPVWPQTAILLISASQVARIIDVSHWWQAALCFLR
jgi:hypothetical protein